MGAPPAVRAEVPSGAVHTFRNDGYEEVRVITMFESAGFEAFFEEFGVDASAPGAFKASVSPEVIERVVEDCGRFGMIIPPAD